MHYGVARNEGAIVVIIKHPVVVGVDRIRTSLHSNRSRSDDRQ